VAKKMKTDSRASPCVLSCPISIKEIVTLGKALRSEGENQRVTNEIEEEKRTLNRKVQKSGLHLIEKVTKKAIEFNFLERS